MRVGARARRSSTSPSARRGCVAATKSLVRRKTREVRAVDGISFDDRAGRGRRLPRPERRRQDDDAQDALRASSTRAAGRRRVLGHVPSKRERDVPEPDHARDGEPEPAAVGPPRARLVRAQPRDLPDPARRLRAAAGRADRAARDRRPRAQAGSPALARRADEGGDRRRAAPPAAGAVPRRADDRARRDDAEAHPRRSSPTTTRATGRRCS